jgi:hypothetical protein
MSRNLFRAYSAFVLSLGLVPGGVSAMTLTAIDQGWINGGLGGFGVPALRNYATGRYEGNEVRAYFIFDLSNADVFSSAKLQLAGLGLLSDQGSETVTLFAVDTDPSVLQTATGGMAAFDDLGSGTVFGSLDVRAAQAQGPQEFNLNSNALSAINNARGGLFAMGAAITSLSSGAGDEVVNFVSLGLNPYPLAQLVGTVAPEAVIPVPAAFWLFGSGLIGLAAFAKRRSA